MRYKFLVFRDQGPVTRDQVRGKREEVKNNVYLVTPTNAIYNIFYVASCLLPKLKIVPQQNDNAIDVIDYNVKFSPELSIEVSS